MSDEEMKDTIPPGFTLRNTFHRGTETIHRVAWSPDGKLFAIAYQKEIIEIRDPISSELIHTLKVKNAISSVAWSPNGKLLALGQRVCLSFWDIETGELRFTLKFGANKGIRSLAWSPNGMFLASGSDDGIVRLWKPENGQLIHEFTEHLEVINCLVWSPDGQLLASGSDDKTIRLWDSKTRRPLEILIGHTSSINSLVWPKDGKTLASASNDEIIIWNLNDKTSIKKLGRHEGLINSLDSSYDGKLLASKSTNGSIYIWSYNTGERIKILNNTKYGYHANIAFCPDQFSLAIPGKADRIFQIWDLNIDAILPHTELATYVSMKAVLLGDQGVGKTSLALALRNQPHVSPESTHSRSVEMISKKEVVLDNGIKETREIILWDLAEQEHYQLIHQMYLDKPDLALILFNTHSTVNSFSSVHYWEQALRFMWNEQQGSQYFQNTRSLKTKFLVATHLDLGEKRHNRQYCREMIRAKRFDNYFEISSTKLIKIEELRTHIENIIDWRTLPRLPFTRLFQATQSFILALRKDEQSQRLFASEELMQRFLDAHDELIYSEELQAEFSTCVNEMDTQGLVKKFQSNDFILLQPEIWDYYISAIMKAAIEESEDSSILEERVLNGAFFVPEEQRLGDKRLERLLLNEVIAYLLGNEVILREIFQNDSFLTFPSLATREQADIMEGNKQFLVIHFLGPIDIVYVKLVIKLSYSFFFNKKNIGKNFAVFIPNNERDEKENICGIYLRRDERINGSLTLFFGKKVSDKDRFLFEEYIYRYLLSSSLKESINREYIYMCSNCEEAFPRSMILHRRQLGFNTIKCSVCETTVSIEEKDRELLSVNWSDIYNIEQAIETKRNEEIENTNLYSKSLEKIIRGEFDVFLCYNQSDKSAVKKIREQLMSKGIAPWFDEGDIRPGSLRTTSIEAQIEAAKSAAVFVGKEGTAPFLQMEISAILQQFTERNVPIIPVLLEDASEQPQLPPFLKVFQWVNFRVLVPPAYLPRKIISSMNLDKDEGKVLAESEDYDQNDDWDFFFGEEHNLEQEPQPIDLLVWGITGKRPGNL